MNRAGIVEQGPEQSLEEKDASTPNAVLGQKSRPILFSGQMVRAILDGRKTQTRRIAKNIADWAANENGSWPIIWKGNQSHPVLCPYGQPGDRLWVRETWGVVNGCDHYSIKEIPDAARVPVFRADSEGNLQKWRSSIFMPRWASRITLEITGVRVERLQEISEADALGEGIDDGYLVRNHLSSDRIAAYRMLWEDLNGLESWKENPWVWVICFCRVQEEKV